MLCNFYVSKCIFNNCDPPHNKTSYASKHAAVALKVKLECDIDWPFL
jgi:hypothetical protein